MNEIKIILKESGSVADLYKDFNLYQGCFRNAQITVSVPKSLLYSVNTNTVETKEITNTVLIGAILREDSGKKVTTNRYYLDYVKDVEKGGILYAVYTGLLPKEFTVYYGKITVVVNVTAVDYSDALNPKVIQVVTSQTVQLTVEQSDYVGQEEVIDPSEMEKIYGSLADYGSKLQNGDYPARSFWAWNGNKYYGMDEYVFYKDVGEFGAILKSIINDNAQPPFIEDNVNTNAWKMIVNFNEAIGPVGPAGPIGPAGALWYAGSKPPSVGSQYKTNDMYLNTASGDVYTLNSTGNWVRAGNIRGPQGVRGEQGIQGVQGLVGPQGPQGPQGNPGLPFSIVGTLTTSAQLPTPSKAIRNQAYLIGTAQPYDLYVIGGNDADGYLWVNVGQVEGVIGPVGPQGEQGEPGERGEPGEQGHPVYYVNAELKENPTIALTLVQPQAPLMTVGDLCVGSDGYLARCYQINADQAVMTTLYSLKGDPGASPTGITLEPNTATEGTLTENQLSTLQANDFNYIVLNKEIYHLQDKDYQFRVYTHTGRTLQEGKIKIKTISLTTSALSNIWKWDLQENETGAYLHNISIRVQASSNAPYQITFSIYSSKQSFSSNATITLEDVVNNMVSGKNYYTKGITRINFKYYSGCYVIKTSTGIRVYYYSTFPNNVSSTNESSYNLNFTTTDQVYITDTLEIIE